MLPKARPGHLYGSLVYFSRFEVISGEMETDSRSPPATEERTVTALGRKIRKRSVWGSAERQPGRAYDNCQSCSHLWWEPAFPPTTASANACSDTGLCLQINPHTCLPTAQATCLTETKESTDAKCDSITTCHFMSLLIGRCTSRHDRECCSLPASPQHIKLPFVKHLSHHDRGSLMNHKAPSGTRANEWEFLPKISR